MVASFEKCVLTSTYLLLAPTDASIHSPLPPTFIHPPLHLFKQSTGIQFTCAVWRPEINRLSHSRVLDELSDAVHLSELL